MNFDDIGQHFESYGRWISARRSKVWTALTILIVLDVFTVFNLFFSLLDFPILRFFRNFATFWQIWLLVFLAAAVYLYINWQFGSFRQFMPLWQFWLFCRLRSFLTANCDILTVFGNFGQFGSFVLFLTFFHIFVTRSRTQKYEFKEIDWLPFCFKMADIAKKYIPVWTFGHRVT